MGTPLLGIGSNIGPSIESCQINAGVSYEPLPMKILGYVPLGLKLKKKAVHLTESLAWIRISTN